MFSSSFDSSAASGLETTSTSSQTRSYSSRAACGAVVGEAADHLHRVAQREVGAPGVHALGREGDVEVAAGREAGLLEHRDEPLARGARIGRRLEHHQLALAQHPRQRRCRRRSAGRRSGWRFSSSGVGTQIDDRVRLRQVVVVAWSPSAGRADTARASSSLRHVLDVALAGADRLDPARVGVQARPRGCPPARTRAPGAGPRSRGPPPRRSGFPLRVPLGFSLEGVHGSGWSRPATSVRCAATTASPAWPPP